ncbi:MAG: 3-phosphoshikimate 1-carboxyvinyltransferase, partial [Blastocatellia bacterium]|nr:3-phosphoshikimate 1-carboxyvinyltransferase [Blastocatellia bacterium]
GKHIAVRGGTRPKARDINVPSDISSAAFLAVASACLPDSTVRIRRVGLNPTRTGIIDILRSCGVAIVIEKAIDLCNEPLADIVVSSAELTSPPKIDGPIIANIIDELPIIAVLGTQLPHGIEVRGAAELRVKESDRINSIVKNLRAIGAKVDEFEDGFHVRRSDIIGGEIDSFGDHRIAMAFAVAGLLSKDGVSIKNADCTDISFPSFFETLASLVE